MDTIRRRQPLEPLFCRGLLIDASCTVVTFVGRGPYPRAADHRPRYRRLRRVGGVGVVKAAQIREPWLHEVELGELTDARRPGLVLSPCAGMRSRSLRRESETIACSSTTESRGPTHRSSFGAAAVTSYPSQRVPAVARRYGMSASSRSLTVTLTLPTATMTSKNSAFDSRYSAHSAARRLVDGLIRKTARIVSQSAFQ
jgi:hypothetical protein